MIHKAIFTFETPDAGIIAASLKPESDKEEGRAWGMCRALSNTSFEIHVNAEDLTSLRAALNTWLRLVQIAEEMVQRTKKAGTTNE